jgi:hypothetical protein
VTGTAEADSTVRLFEGPNTRGTTQADASGNWSVPLSGVAEGNHTYTAKATDAAGNTSDASNARTVIVDTTTPNTRITDGPDGVTKDDTPTFNFSGSDNLSATAELRYSFRVDNGTWSQFSTSTSATVGGSTGLPDGPHTFFVRALDRAGNSDTSPAQRSFTVDATAPDPPVIDAPRQNAGVTDSFVVTGTAEADSTVRLFEGPNTRGTTQADASGNWSVPLSGVAEGNHTYTARATDAAGNTSDASNARTVVVDTTAPKVESTVPAANAKGVDPAANIEVFFSEEMKAFTVNDSSVKLFRANSATPIVAAVDYDAAAEKATLDPSDPLVQGKSYKAVVNTRARDKAGNRLDQNPSLRGLQLKKWFFTVRR